MLINPALGEVETEQEFIASLGYVRLCLICPVDGCGLQSPDSPGSHHLHLHSHLSLETSSPFWGHPKHHLHLLLVHLLPVSEMDNLQNQKCKTDPQECNTHDHPLTVDLHIKPLKGLSQV